jgi:hypothetical protein
LGLPVLRATSRIRSTFTETSRRVGSLSSNVAAPRAAPMDVGAPQQPTEPRRPNHQATVDKNRVEKLLEDACIKLSVVASDIFGVSGDSWRHLGENLDESGILVDGGDEGVLGSRDDGCADRRRARPEGPRRPDQGTDASQDRDPRGAFAGLPAGGFDDHHRFLLERMLSRIDAIDADIAALDAQSQAGPTGPRGPIRQQNRRYQ